MGRCVFIFTRRNVPSVPGNLPCCIAAIRWWGAVSSNPVEVLTFP